MTKPPTKPLTVGELKALIRDLPDDLEVCLVVSDEDICIAGDLRGLEVAEDELGSWLQLDGWEEYEDDEEPDEPETLPEEVDSSDDDDGEDPPVTGGALN